MSQKISKLLKKTSDIDKDERFMAVSDICNELSNIEHSAASSASSSVSSPSPSLCSSIDVSLQVHLASAILDRLEDASTDVQTVTIKLLSLLTKKLSIENLKNIIDKLLTLLFNPQKHESRDIYSIGLKTIIQNIPLLPQAASSDAIAATTTTNTTSAQNNNNNNSANNAASASAAASLSSSSPGLFLLSHILTLLLSNLAADLPRELLQDNNRVDMECMSLDIMRDCVLKCARFLSPDIQQRSLSLLQPRVECSIDSIRKRSVACLVAIVPAINDAMFQQLISRCMQQLQQQHNDTTYAYIQTIGMITTQAGVRIEAYLPQILPLLKQNCNLDSHDENMVELWENCLQAFESIIENCPHHFLTHLPSLAPLLQQCISYDPNYIYDESATGDGEHDHHAHNDQQDEWGDDDEGDGWGDDERDDDAMADDDDDDDSTWRIRRISVKVFIALLKATNVDAINNMYDDMWSMAIKRIKERNKIVKLSLLSFICDLIHKCVFITKQHDHSQHSHSLSQDDQLHAHTLVATSAATQHVSTPNQLFFIMEKHLNNIVSILLKQLNDKHIDNDIKRGIIQIFTAFINIQPNTNNSAPLLSSYLPSLFTSLLHSIQHDDIRVKYESLYLLHTIFDRYSSSTLFVTHTISTTTLINALLHALTDNYVKFKSEALRTLTSLLHAFGSLSSSSTTNSLINDQLITQIYAAVFTQLNLNDIDQEVKETSLQTMSILFYYFGHLLKQQLSECMAVIITRFNNELTRIAALRAFTIIASSTLNLNIDFCVEKCIVEIIGFLKKDSQVLKHETVITLTSIIRNCSSRSSQLLSTQHLLLILKDIIPHMNDSDLFLTSLLLELLLNILPLPHCVLAENDSDPIVQRLLLIIKSPLLQQHHINSLRAVFQALHATNVRHALKNSHLSLSYLLESLIRQCDVDTSVATALCIAQCITGLIERDASELEKTSNMFMEQIANAQAHAYFKQLALLCIGELGRTHDLTTKHSSLYSTLFSQFSHANDNVKHCAAFSLGNVAIGNLEKYVPLLLELMEKQQQYNYLILNALKELLLKQNQLSSDKISVFKPYIPSISSALFKHATDAEEGIRFMVSECLGSLALFDHESLFKQFQLHMQDAHPFARSTVITAIRYSFNTHTSHELFTYFQQHFLTTFLNALKDSDINVCRQALLSVHTLAHIHFPLIRPHLTSHLLPVLYQHTAINASLIRVVDMGPFKHKVDDGLPIRKTTYQILQNLLDINGFNLDMIDVHVYLQHISVGITDNNGDIVMLVFEILCKFAAHHGTFLLPLLDSLPNKFMDCVKENIKIVKAIQSDAAQASNAANNAAPAPSQYTPQDGEKANEILRSFCKCIYTIQKVPGVDKCVAYGEFYQRVLKTQMLVTMLQELQATSS